MEYRRLGRTGLAGLRNGTRRWRPQPPRPARQYTDRGRIRRVGAARAGRWHQLHRYRRILSHGKHYRRSPSPARARQNCHLEQKAPRPQEYHRRRSCGLACMTACAASEPIISTSTTCMACAPSNMTYYYQEIAPALLDLRQAGLIRFPGPHGALEWRFAAPNATASLAR